MTPAGTTVSVGGSPIATDPRKFFHDSMEAGRRAREYWSGVDQVRANCRMTVWIAKISWII